MLTDQSFHQPIKVLIGPELFYANNPLQLNVAHAQQFNRVICPSGMFQLYYLAFKDSKTFGEQKQFTDDLIEYGLVITPILVDRPVDAETHRMVEELAQVAEICYPTEVLKACSLRGRRPYSNGAERFIEALTIQVQTTAGWDWENFIEF